MMLRKPTCADCPHNLQYMERLPIKKKGVTMHLGERFCVAGKRARKFKRSDPKTYVPSWCPRLKAPCELRIYGFKNQREWRMHRSMRAYLGEDTSPSAFRYAVRYEGHTDLAPYEFFECCNVKSDDEILGAAVQHYDVVEIDDGNLLSQLGGKPGAVQTLEKLEQAEKTAEDKLAALLEQLRGAPQDDPALSAAVVKAANDAESKRRQADTVNKLVDAGFAQNQAEAGALIARAVSAAAERAEEVQTILGAWSDAPGDMRKTDANAALLERVRDSKTLQDISRYLGRFREIFAQGKRNGYAYGRGEKYALELGNDLSRALTSELAMLAVPETLPLFLRKYQHRQIKQYRRREPVYKGAGDIICCLDESGSTAGDLAAWGKAVALTLLEIAQSEGRKFALVHFSGPGRFQTDVFLPGQSSLEEKLHAAETFLGGGTDFQTPLAEAERLMREGGFENADIAFITDGECSLPETCVEMLQKAQSELRFTVTGILLDEGNAGMDFSLKPFCQNIYRTSELTGDQIVGEIVLDRV